MIVCALRCLTNLFPLWDPHEWCLRSREPRLQKRVIRPIALVVGFFVHAQSANEATESQQTWVRVCSELIKLADGWPRKELRPVLPWASSN
jgi:hypothetical protein